MSVFGKLLGRGGSDAKRQGNDLASKSEPTPDQSALTRQVQLNSSWPEPAAEPQEAPAAPASIWDMDAAPAIPAPSDTAETSGRVLAGPVRKTRAKTRLLGFDKSDGRVVDLFSNPVDAYRASWYPGVRRHGPCAVVFHSDDFFEILRAYRFMKS